MVRKAYWKTAAVVLALNLLTCAQLLADPSTQPLVRSDDLVYLGAFALPGGTYGASRFGYSGNALTAYNDPSGRNTLFLGGHAWDAGTVAQVEIPSDFVISQNWSDLPQATVLQDFFDIADDRWASLGTTAYVSVYGMLPYNGRLIVGAASWYDAPCNQTASQGVSTFDLSMSNDFQGFITIDAAANPRSIGGYMTTVPDEWHVLLGGPALAGNAALSIISCISSGPAATVFDPDQVGAQGPVSGTTLVYYPLTNHLVSGGMTTENTFTFGSNVKGIAFPSGTRSVLFFGRHTMADGYCYGPGTNDPNLHKVPTEGGTWCYDLCSHSKGGHGYPYYHYVWAYDANDLVEVAAGRLSPWEVAPYDSWQLSEMDNSGCAGIRGAGYDPETRRLFITQGYGESARVEVYQINQTPSQSDPGNNNDNGGGSDSSSSCYIGTVSAYQRSHGH